MVPFCLYCSEVSLLKPNSRKKGTLIIQGTLGNLESSSRGLYSSIRTLKILERPLLGPLVSLNPKFLKLPYGRRPYVREPEHWARTPDKLLHS